jgi:ribosomal protein S18 acetylase RimI-like enzyme
MTHPKHFRKEIAEVLLAFVESNIEDFETTIVSTGSKNTPAVTFYLKNGFYKRRRNRSSRISIFNFF